jgi:hypothetical protein
LERHYARSERAYRRALKEVRSITRVESENENKLIHKIGRLKVGSFGPAVDPNFDLSKVTKSRFIKMIRSVEMYQWQEIKSSNTSENWGGSKTTVTSFEYEKEWADRVIDERQFRMERGHTNPKSMPFKSVTVLAKEVLFGDSAGEFSLNAELTKNLPCVDNAHFTPLGEKTELTAFDDGVTLSEVNKLGDKVKNVIVDSNDTLKLYDGDEPKLGDIRFKYKVLGELDSDYTIVACQGANGELKPMEFRDEDATPVCIIRKGRMTAVEAIEDEHNVDANTKYFIRWGCFFLNVVGCRLMCEPLVVFTTLVPFLSSVVGASAWLVSIPAGAVLTAVPMTLGYIAARPWLFYSTVAVTTGGVVTYYYINGAHRGLISKVDKM